MPPSSTSCDLIKAERQERNTHFRKENGENLLMLHFEPFSQLWNFLPPKEIFKVQLGLCVCLDLFTVVFQSVSFPSKIGPQLLKGNRQGRDWDLKVEYLLLNDPKKNIHHNSNTANITNYSNWGRHPLLSWIFNCEVSVCWVHIYSHFNQGGKLMHFPPLEII